MTVVRSFRKLFRKGKRFLTQRRGTGDRPVEGLPPGLPFEQVNEVCLLQIGHPLQKTWHIPLSTWKTTCATYRIWLQPTRSKRWSLVYKRAIYQQDRALQGLPVKPGLPEYLVYRHKPGPLADYLPRVYACVEIHPDESYLYLLEDLGDSYRKNAGPEGVLEASHHLPALHQALAQWMAGVDPDALLCYDQMFSKGLVEYVQTSLERYYRTVNTPSTQHFSQIWPEIRDAYSRLERDIPVVLSPIHGDYNISNILYHKEAPEQIKILDWEWTGLGLPHADLASLLNSANGELEQKVLEGLLPQMPGRSLKEHHLLYQWCKLQRGLLDASFTAWHVLDNPDLPGFNRSQFIDMALRRAGQAFEALAG